MARIRIMAICLAAACATAAWAASAASGAQPEFYGKAALGATVQPVKITFTTGAAFIEGHQSKSKYTCENLAGSGAGGVGEVTGPHTIKHVVITLTKCKSGELACTGSGQVTGTIVTYPLEGTLGNVTATVPGIRLFREGESGKEPKNGTIEEFECGAGILKAVVRGSIIGSLSGAAGETPEEGKINSPFKITYTMAGGIQKYTSFLAGECGGLGECGPEQETVFFNGTPELWGRSIMNTVTTTPFANNLGFTK